MNKKTSFSRLISGVLVLVCTLGLLACTHEPNARKLIVDDEEPLPQLGEPGKHQYQNPNDDTLKQAVEAVAEKQAVAEQIYKGDGQLLKPRGAAAGAQEEKIDAVMNFENADIREVVAVILGDLLKVPYLIDTQVNGKVTLRNQQPLSRSGLLSVLESALELNGVALVNQQGLYRIVPRAAARSSTLVSGAYPASNLPGLQVRVIPLRYMAANEMKKLMEPFVSKEDSLRVDVERNLLIATGTNTEVQHLLNIRDMFDVDWLEGKSVGLFPVENTDAPTITAELEEILSSGESGVMKDVIRLVPVERLNSILAITNQASYLDTVRTWLRRLDLPGGGAANERQLFVYRVQNGRAEDVASLLQDLFGIEVGGKTEVEPELAPGATPKLVQLRPGDSASAGAGSAAADVIKVDTRRQTETLPKRESAVQSQEPSRSSDGVRAGADAFTNVGIVADESRNALLILTTPDKYPMIEKALKLLDVPPLQVLLEATIVDVNLSGELSNGVQWFFKNNNVLGDFEGNGTVGLPLALGATFNYTLSPGADDIRLFLSVLETQDKIRVIASPSLLVLDNETANIRVGDQQPISTTVVTEGGVVSNSVQFKDTGVSLEVTPRVNDGGLVTLDVSQELTDTGAIDDATGQRAFLERRVKTRVAINSGESVVLGGLIRESNARSNSGVPYLHDVPVLGFFFGQKLNTVERTELLVILNATVVRNEKDLRELAAEFRRRMSNIYPVEDSKE